MLHHGLHLLKLVAAGPITASTELESLFYIFIFWACHGKLHWGGAAGSAALDMRKTAMRDDFEAWPE